MRWRPRSSSPERRQPSRRVVPAVVGRVAAGEQGRPAVQARAQPEAAACGAAPVGLKAVACVGLVAAPRVVRAVPNRAAAGARPRGGPVPPELPASVTVPVTGRAPAATPMQQGAADATTARPRGAETAMGPVRLGAVNAARGESTADVTTSGAVRTTAVETEMACVMAARPAVR
jgi:hypothetical protein